MQNLPDARSGPALVRLRRLLQPTQDAVHQLVDGGHVHGDPAVLIAPEKLGKLPIAEQPARIRVSRSSARASWPWRRSPSAITPVSIGQVEPLW